MREMSGTSAGLVAVIREFLTAHRLTTRLIGRYRSGELRFPEFDALIDDSEDSVLFRLKERCHALFRPEDGRNRDVRHQEVLFDLAVGSLFHEAMKLREDFYQREVYGPRMRELRSEAGEGTDALFREFERILAAVSERIEEVVQEVEALLLRTREQLRLLIAERRREGHVTRCLLEYRAQVEEVFGQELDALFVELYGSAAEGYASAGRSYLASGYFGEAERGFAEALARGGDRAAMERLCDYARGMRAYVAGDYGESVARLGRWVDAADPADPDLVAFAHAAVSHIGRVAAGRAGGAAPADATALLARIAARQAASASAPTLERK